MENESQEELMQLIEESWYWSTINDIVDMFDKYGMDNVLADVGNMKIQREEAKSKDIDQ
jgi:Golgi nucleoside diphosphatase